MKFNAQKLAAKLSTRSQDRWSCWKKKKQREKKSQEMKIITAKYHEYFFVPKALLNEWKGQFNEDNPINEEIMNDDTGVGFPTQVWALFRFKRYDLNPPARYAWYNVPEQKKQ